MDKRKFKENYFIFFSILITFIFILFFVDFNQIFEKTNISSDLNPIQKNLTENKNINISNDIKQNNTLQQDSYDNQDIAIENKLSVEDLDDNDMYYCYKYDDKSYEIYFSKNLFSDFYNSELTIYDGKNLYRKIKFENCDWYILNQDIDNYFNIVFSYLKNSDYICEKNILDKKLFSISNDENICDEESYMIYSMYIGGGMLE